MAPIGFVLVTYKNPTQIIRLIAKLNQMFDNPPIACHHDFYKSHLPSESLTRNVSIVQPHLLTGWGVFAVSEAMLRALALLYSRDDSPDWFILLSEADYPIKSASRILSDLKSSQYDAHLAHVEINSAADADWEKLCVNRYCTVKLTVPFVNRKLQLTKRKLKFKPSVITRPLLPFSRDLRCFAGEVWFCANRKAAEYLLDFHRRKPRLARHYRSMDAYETIPEESYHHTILCNAPGLSISPNNWRYVDWSAGGKHPAILRLKDMENLEQTSAHFARKFDIDADSSIIDEIDAFIHE